MSDSERHLVTAIAQIERWADEETRAMREPGVSRTQKTVHKELAGAYAEVLELLRSSHAEAGAQAVSRVPSQEEVQMAENSKRAIGYAVLPWFPNSSEELAAFGLEEGDPFMVTE